MKDYNSLHLLQPSQARRILTVKGLVIKESAKYHDISGAQPLFLGPPSNCNLGPEGCSANLARNLAFC